MNIKEGGDDEDEEPGSVGRPLESGKSRGRGDGVGMCTEKEEGLSGAHNP